MQYKISANLYHKINYVYRNITYNPVLFEEVFQEVEHLICSM